MPLNWDDVYRSMGVQPQQAPQQNPLSWNDVYRNMGVGNNPAGGGGTPAAGGVGNPVQSPQSNIYDPTQSSSWNLFNGRTQTAAEANGGNRTWDPSQHQDVTSAWLNAGMPSQTYQGVNTVGGGMPATWNGQQTNNGFQDSLRQQNMTPQGTSQFQNTMGQPGSYTNQPQGPNMGRTRQQSWGNNYGMPNTGQNPYAGSQQTPGWGTQGRQPWGMPNQRSGGKGGF